MIKRLWFGTIVVLLMMVAGCGTAASRHVATSGGQKSCPVGTTSVSENGATHCLVTEMSPTVTTSASISAINAYINIPMTLHIWPTNTPIWHTAAKVALPFAWEAWQPLLHQGSFLGIAPQNFEGIGVNPTLGAAGATNLYLSAQFDATEWLSVTLPSGWFTPKKAPQLAKWSIALLKSWTTSLTSKGHPNVVLRWMVTPTQFIQIGRTGTTTDATLVNDFGQLEGWAITEGQGTSSAITANTRLLSPPTALVPSYVPSSNWVYSSSNATTWLTQVFEHYTNTTSFLGSVPSGSSVPSSVPISSAPSSSISLSPSNVLPSSSLPSSSPSVAPSSTLPSSSSPSAPPRYLSVTSQDAPTGIRVSWQSASPGVPTPTQGCRVTFTSARETKEQSLQNDGILTGLTVGHTYTVQQISCANEAFGTGSTPIEYGTVANMLTSLGARALNASEDTLYVQYDKWLPAQTPDQDFADYVVEDVTAHVRLPVTSASISSGQLRLDVTLPANVQPSDTIQLTTTVSVVQTQHGAPSITDGSSPLN